MKKIVFLLMAGIIGYSESIFSNCLMAINQCPHWTGFYLGGNAGLWGSETNNITSTSSVSFINPTFESGATNIANALAQLSNNHFSVDSYGLIVGGQAGYNFEFNRRFLIGINIDFDGLTNSNNVVSLRRFVNLTDFDESYSGSFSINEKINYLGSVGARFGYLCNPNLLVYAKGGFAYGNVTLNTSWVAQESLGPDVFPTITAKNNSTQTLTGWTAGIGAEWFFTPNLSTTIDYSYYSLNKLNVPVTLSQTNASLSPPSLWGSAATNTTLSLATWAFRVGINYHFL